MKIAGKEKQVVGEAGENPALSRNGDKERLHISF